MADAAAVPAAAHAGGLPQFDLAQWPGQIVWLLLVFLVMYLMFAKVFVPAIGGTIADREDKIAGDIGDARRLKAEAEADAVKAAGEMAAVRARAQKVASDAKEEAKQATLARQAAEDARLAETMAAAEARIAAARAEAMSHVRGIALDTADAMISHLTGKAPAAGEVEQALPAQA